MLPWDEEVKPTLPSFFLRGSPDSRLREPSLPSDAAFFIGAAERYRYILRNESMHRNFGIDLEPLCPNEELPFRWMSEMIGLKKERNFFETRVIEYQSGGALSWD